VPGAGATNRGGLLGATGFARQCTRPARPAAQPAQPIRIETMNNIAESNGATVDVPTEDELLNAPEDQYMDARQLEFFRQRLQAQRSEIEADIERARGELSSGENEPDELDRASAEEERWLSLRISEREGKLLRKIDEALARIEDGDYGYCEDTGDPIGIPRLLARPTATLSAEAKSRREQLEKTHGPS
jgi:DnaK suppressor protein